MAWAGLTGAAKGDGRRGQCTGGRLVTKGTGGHSVSRRGLLSSKSTAGAARATCLYFQETIQHPACSSPTSGWAWREPCSLWECKQGSSPVPTRAAPPAKPAAGAFCPSRDPVFSSGDSFGIRGIPKPAPSQALPPQFVFQRSFQGGETRKGDPSGHNTNAWRSSQGLGSRGDRK